MSDGSVVEMDLEMDHLRQDGRQHLLLDELVPQNGVKGVLT